MTETTTRSKLDKSLMMERNFSPPKTEDESSTSRKGKAGFPRTAGLLCHDSVTMGTETVEGESEPRYDPVYERQDVKLSRRDGTVTNSQALKFEGSIPWSGPVLFVVAYDEQGKEASRAAAPSVGWPPEFAEDSLEFKGKDEFE